ncbi:ester cyclase [Cohnella sp. GCM10027633]|uniref:ester cyclase n=1 Tax=unclassified Cohnella TaxID=2636738 RepID=UPI0036287408
MSEANKTLARQFIQGFWNEGESECAERLLAADYTDHAYQPGNKDGLLQMAGVLNAAFPDQSSTEESIVAFEDRVIVRLRMRGTHLGPFRGKEATNRPIDVQLYREFRIVDGRISEHWALFDTLALLRQIGD